MHRSWLVTAIGLFVLVCTAWACGGEETSPAPEAEPVAETPPPPPPEPPTRPGPTCSYHGWCWQSPFPQGNGLFGVHAFAADLVYAVGERGTVLRYDGSHWAIEDTPNRELLRGVWGADADTVWAVGEAGTLLRRVDDTWVVVDVALETALHDVWGRAADDAYAVGEAGVILHWDGESWTREPLETTLTLMDVIGDDGEAVYALGVETGPRASGGGGLGERLGLNERAVVFSRGPEGWAEDSTLEGDLGAIVLDGESLLVAGAEAQRRPLGSDWSGERLQGSRPVNAMFDLPDGVVAVGYDGRVVRYAGTTWTSTTLEGEPDLRAVHGVVHGFSNGVSNGVSEEDLWAVGADGALAHFDGTVWTLERSGSTHHLKSVWGRGPNDVWAVGDHAMIHFDGEHWREDGPDDYDLRAVWGVDDLLVAAGDEGALLRHVGRDWVPEHQNSTYELVGIWGADAAHTFVTGKTVWLEHRVLEDQDGEWIEHPERPPAASAWGVARDDVWVAGREGLHHWDGSAWSQVESTRDMILFGVFGFAHDDVWVVGAGGRLMHYDGTRWSEVEVPTEQNLLALWGSAPDDLWAVGHHGTILHHDGESWRWRDSGTDELLHSVWGSGPNDVFVVGHGGTVLHYGGAPGE